MSIITVSKTELVKGLEKAVHGVKADTNLPILETVQIMAKGDTMFLCTTDLEIMIVHRIALNEECDVFNKCINCRFLYDYLRKVDGDDVVMEEIKDSNLCMVRCGTNEITTQTLDTANFPVFNVTEPNPIVFCVKADALGKGIKNVLYSASTDPNRPILNTVHMDLEEEFEKDDKGIVVKNLNFVGIDGFRAAIQTVKLAGLNEDTHFKVNVPLESSKKLNSLLAKSSDEIKITVGKKYLTLQHAQTSIYVQLYDGEYMNYKNILPKDFCTAITVKTEEFLTGVEVVDMLKSVKPAPLFLNVNEQELLLSTKTDVSSYKKGIPIYKEGEDIVIGFNPVYISNALKILESEETIMKFSGKVNPAVIKNKDDDSFTYMVLPLRNVS